MKSRNVLLAAAGTLALGAASVMPAKAAEVLYNGAGFLQGTQSFTDTFAVTSPGQLTVTLGNVNFPAALSGLQLLVSSANGKLGPTMQQNMAGTSTSNFDVLGAGDIYAQWFGTATGSLDAGAYTLEIQFSPSGGSGNTVPLPTSIALLLSGIGLLVWQRRTRTGLIQGEMAPSGEAETA